MVLEETDLDLLMRTLLDALPAAGERWSEAENRRSETTQLNEYFSLISQLVSSSASPPKMALAAQELLKLARSAALAGGAQDRLARQAGVSLEAILHRQEVQDTLASSPEKWAWLCEWLSRPADAPSSEQRRSPVGGVHAASNAPPSGGEGGKLAGLLHRCAPAATLPPRVESDAPRVVVENAGTAAANGTYIFAGDLPGHGPMFSRVDGPRTWVIFPTKLRPGAALETLPEPLRAQAMEFLQGNGVNEVDALDNASTEAQEMMVQCLPATARLFRSVWWVIASFEHVVSWLDAALSTATVLQETRQLSLPAQQENGPMVLEEGEIVLDGPMALEVGDIPRASEANVTPPRSSEAAEPAGAGALTAGAEGLQGVPPGVVIYYQSAAPSELPGKHDVAQGAVLRVRVPEGDDEGVPDWLSVQKLERAARDDDYADNALPENDAPKVQVLRWGVVKGVPEYDVICVVCNDRSTEVQANMMDVDKIIGLPGGCVWACAKGNNGAPPSPSVWARPPAVRLPLVGCLNGGNSSSVVDLTGNDDNGMGNNADTIQMFQTHIWDLANQQIDTARARDLLEKNNWNMDSAAIAFLESNFNF